MNAPSPVIIDGSEGEGGGQIVRTALALSLVTGRPVELQNIRAGRKKPGLQQQHLTAVRAAADVGAARTEGAEAGSRRLVFEPREVRPGQYAFSIGTAGSATLVVQTVLPALMTAGAASHLSLEGGTHNPWAPPYDFLEKTFAPLVSRMGPSITMRLKRPGFYPVGGGAFSVEIVPVAATAGVAHAEDPSYHRPPPLERIDLLQRGAVRRLGARAIVSRLPLAIAQRELTTLRHRLPLDESHCTAESVEAKGPGNAVMVEVAGECVTEVFVGFGQKGVPAERVAADLALEVKQYLKADVPVGSYLADQLLIPMALAGGGTFRTLRPTSHLRTNAEVIRRFLDVEILAEKLGREDWQVTIARR